MTNASTTQTQQSTVGIDLGDRWSRFCVIDETGKILQERRVMTCAPGMQAEFDKRPRMRIAIEAGTHSPWVSRLLSELGHEVFVANPRKLRAIYKSDSKNDKLDAQMLARIGRADPELLAPIVHRGEEAQIDLARVRARNALVETRTTLINHVRGSVKSFGGRLPKCSAESFRNVAEFIPASLLPALSPLLLIIGDLTKEIGRIDGELKRLCQQRYPEGSRLRQVAGVGPVTTLTYMLTIDDPKRFEKSREVGPYLGLRPKQRDSGDSSPQLGITKSGDVYLRSLLVNCAHYILGPFGPDTDLRRWGLEIAKRGAKNAKKRAVIAVARKLAVLLHRLWVSGETYEPLRKANRQLAAVQS